MNEPAGDLPQATSQATADFRRQVDALYRMKEKAFAEQTPDPIVDFFYAKNAVTFGPEGKPSIGRAEFQELYKNIVKLGEAKVEPVFTHVGTDAAWEWVNFHVISRDPAAKDFTLIMLFVWAKEGDRWISGGDAYSIGSFNTKS